MSFDAGYHQNKRGGLCRVVQAIFLAACLVFPNEGFADPANDLHKAEQVQTSARLKVDLAGRQRMLTQHIGKDACFSVMGIDREKHITVMLQAVWLFEDTLVNLREGNAALGLVPARDPDVLAALEHVEDFWLTYKAAVTNVVSGDDPDQRYFHHLLAGSVELLKRSQLLVVQLKNYHSNEGNVSPYAATAIDLSGRQQMLSQKMAKEYCLIAAGINYEEQQKALKRSLVMFESTAEALKTGNHEYGFLNEVPGIIQDEIDRAMVAYEPIKPIFHAALLDEEVSHDEVLAVAKDNLKVLLGFDNVVKVYVALN